jgi:hypothetical protein
MPNQLVKPVLMMIVLVSQIQQLAGIQLPQALMHSFVNIILIKQERHFVKQNQERRQNVKLLNVRIYLLQVIRVIVTNMYSDVNF